MKNFVPWHNQFCLIFHSLSGKKETSESNVVFIILLKRVEHVKSVEKYNGSIYSILGRINFLCAFMDETGHLLSKIILSWKILFWREKFGSFRKTAFLNMLYVFQNCNYSKMEFFIFFIKTIQKNNLSRRSWAKLMPSAREGEFSSISDWLNFQRSVQKIMTWSKDCVRRHDQICLEETFWTVRRWDFVIISVLKYADLQHLYTSGSMPMKFNSILYCQNLVKNWKRNLFSSTLLWPSISESIGSI